MRQTDKHCWDTGSIIFSLNSDKIGVKVTLRKCYYENKLNEQYSASDLTAIGLAKGIQPTPTAAWSSSIVTWQPDQTVINDSIKNLLKGESNQIHKFDLITG